MRMCTLPQRDRRDAPLPARSDGTRDTVRRMETFEPRERSLDWFEALGPTELKGGVYPMLLFRAAPS